MVNQSNFVVRASGKRENCCYIDYSGAYKVEEIAELIGAKPEMLKEKYLMNGAIYDESLDVYYFGSTGSAENTISEILRGIKPEKKGRSIILTEAEIEYIRKALINEGVNTIHLGNKIKDAIFKKLNG